MSITRARAAIRILGWTVAIAVAASFDGCSCGSSSSSPEADAAMPEGGATLATDNLIQNPGGDLGPGSPDGTLVMSIPDWTISGEANIIQYGASGGYPGTMDPGPTDRGMNFFGGGPDDAVSTFTQTVDLTSYASDVAAGGATFTLSAYLGGYSSQEDDATLTIYFLNSPTLQVIGAADEDGGDDDAGDAAALLPAGVLGTATIGPVTAEDRMSNTGLLPVSTTGAVPAGTVAVEVQLVMTRYSGANNDGYADDLSLTLSK